jgi:UDP-N-acetylmuramoyl-L-alanyl-D-glutamate--2,6-diaminopimelate ligase
MHLKNLLEEIYVLDIRGKLDSEVSGISYDSRDTIPGDLFICKGVDGDGHEYAREAYENGARAFIIEKELGFYYPDAVYISTDDTKKALSLLSRKFYGYPENDLITIGITGTKGKTTTAFYIKALMDGAGKECGLIGTIRNIVGRKTSEAQRTTPEAYDIQKMMRRMIDEQMKAVVMEVTSHALILKRVAGMEFDIGIFTNLSQDHLDFHKNMDDYFAAKMKLFEHCRACLINIDDHYGKKAFDILNEKGKDIYTISVKDDKADFFAFDIKDTLDHTSFRISAIKGTLFKNGMHGRYNVYNSLCALGAASIAGADISKLGSSLAKVKVPGRQERYENFRNDNVIIDYAHSPQSLQEILETYRSVKKNRLISVFGAGGDRDRTKRPIMGEISARLSDLTIITSDNPRTEKPEDIIREIEQGAAMVKGASYVVISDRREAIKYAIEKAEKDDIIILAGKGHETYQEIDHVKHHMDEREILDDIYKEFL